MNTDNFIIHIKTEDGYQGITSDLEERFDTSNNEVSRSLPKEKIKNVIRLVKDELGCKDNKMCKTYLKTYSYLIDDGREDRKAKGTKKCI